MNSTLYHYVLILSGTATLLLAAVAGFNAFVDPYGMYRLFEREGFNDNKPAIYNRVRLLKAYEVRRLRPESIVLGTSRTHLGIRPSHEGWEQQYKRRYNLAFDGATTKEMYAYLRHAHAAGHLKHVILGLDTYHLSDAPPAARPDFDPALLMQGSTLDGARNISADFKLLTSISTLQASLDTLQARPQPRWLAPDGQRLGEVFFRRPSENFMTCGPRCYFDEIDKLEVRFKLEWKIPPKTGIHAATGPAIPSDTVTSLGYIQKIVDYCLEHNIDLIIFLTPSHAHQLELDALTGNWQSVEDGKRKIVQLLSRVSGKVSLYDFSGYSTITTEPLPPAGSHQEMRYYWDSSHFKENVGDMILDRLLGSHAAGDIPGDFGVKLNADNVDDVIRTLNEKRQEYRRQVPQELEILSDWISDFKKENHIPD